MLKHRSLRFGLLLAEGFSLSALSSFVEQLRLASGTHVDEIVPVGWNTMGFFVPSVQSNCGMEITCSSELIEPPDLDYIVIVGSQIDAGASIPARVTDYLSEAVRIGITLIGLCGGTFILNRLGLRGRDFITCAGGMAAADLANHLIDRHFGRAQAVHATEAVQDRESRGEHPLLNAPPGNTVEDARVRRALQLMERNLSIPLPINSIAAQTGLSSRQLERLFQDAFDSSPAAVYRVIRLRYASWLLDNTSRSITDIALSAGFFDSAHFSRRFKQLHGLTPSNGRGKAMAR